MLTGLTHLHSANRYLVLGFIFLAIIDAIMSRNGNKPYSKQSKMLALLALIFSHVQLTLGLALYFIGEKGINHILNTEGFMGIAAARFYAVEHLLGMLVAIILITVGYSKAKRMDDSMKKYKTVLIYYSIALILIFIMIPWPFMKEFGSWI